MKVNPKLKKFNKVKGFIETTDELKPTNFFCEFCFYRRPKTLFCIIKSKEIQLTDTCDSYFNNNGENEI